MARSKTVVVGRCYRYEPVLFDIAMPPPGRPRRGDILCVTRLHGAPPPGTMGMVHVTDVTGRLMGLVFTNSLRPLKSSARPRSRGRRCG